MTKGRWEGDEREVGEWRDMMKEEVGEGDDERGGRGGVWLGGVGRV